MERKIIQIAATPASASGPTTYTPAVFALCDDGALFVAYDLEPGDKSRVWKSLPNVPPTEG